MNNNNPNKCLCGYEGRIDNVNTHKKKCKLQPIILQLKDENVQLKKENTEFKKRCTTWESIQNISEFDLKTQIESSNSTQALKNEKEFLQLQKEIVKLKKEIEELKNK